ncbi:hypothetical protein ACWCQW_02930 [Streptomyces mirabilis]
MTSNNTPDPLTGQQLDEIETRAAHLYEYGDPTDTRTAGWEELAGTDVPALLAEVRSLRAAMEEIRHLHKDSPMGPCPVCIDADAIAAGGDGLVPYPCPTGRLAGAQDCDPPHVRAAAPTAAAVVSSAAETPGPAVAASEACGKCKQPFDPADTAFDGRARYHLTPYCRGCVDRCHDTEIADHRCVICA